MIVIPPRARVYLLHEPISFHKQIDGLATTARQLMGKDPINGAYFLFLSKSKQCLRILHFDGSGFWLCTKRLSSGSFSRLWPKGSDTYSSLMLSEVQKLIWGEPEHLHHRWAKMAS